MSDRLRLEIAIGQLQFARKYTQSLLADMEDHDWFRMPTGTVTHMAWQVGHLAMAQYGLCLFRIRGRKPEDRELMSSEFRKHFSRGTTPDPDPNAYPAPAEIQGVFERVYAQALGELSEYTDEQLDTPVDEPHAVFATKLGAIYFCCLHEMIHAGQIGLLRRLLGKSPIR